MKSNEYWSERLIELQEEEFRNIDKIIRNVDNQFNTAQIEIEDRLEELFRKFADGNNLSIEDAKKLVPKNELEKLKKKLGDIPAIALDPEFQKDLDNFHLLNRVSVLRAQHTQLQAIAEELYGRTEEEILNSFADSYTRLYYKNIYQIQKAVGEGIAFARLNEDTIFQVLMKPWKYGYFSEHWQDSKNDLVEELTDAMTKAFMQGRSKDYVISTFRKRMDVSKYRASRIILTEHSNICGNANLASYEETGVTKYQFVATLDGRTSEECRHMDNKVIELKDREVGVNFPPLHCFCRSTTVPYWKGINEKMQRIARDSDGRTYKVPADMSYEDWYKKHVLGEDDSEDIEDKPKKKEEPKKKPKEAPFDYAKYQKLRRKDIEPETTKFLQSLTPYERKAPGVYVATGNSFKLNKYLYTGEYEKNKERFAPVIEKYDWDNQGFGLSFRAKDQIRQKYGDGPIFQKQIDDFSSVIQKARIPEDMIVVRNVDADFLPYITEQAKVDTGELTDFFEKLKNREEFDNFDFKSALKKDKELIKNLNKKLSGVQYRNLSFTSTSYNATENVFTNRPVQFEFCVDKGTKGFITQNWGESEIVFDKNSRVEIIEVKQGDSGSGLKIIARLFDK